MAATASLHSGVMGLLWHCTNAVYCCCLQYSVDVYVIVLPVQYLLLLMLMIQCTIAEYCCLTIAICLPYSYFKRFCTVYVQLCMIYS